jgi:hypothetical protein
MTNLSMSLPLTCTVNSSACFVFPSYVVTASLTINMVLGLPANCYILWLSVKEIIQGQSTEIFVFNAALVESVFCISYIFLIRQI